MKKFFVVAWLILAAFIAQTTPAFAAYSDDQIINTFRSRIVRMAKTDKPEFKWWRHRESDWSFCAANDCYLSTNGTVYTIFLKPGKVMNGIFVITQMDLNSNSFRFIEGYAYSAANGALNKVPDSQVATNWRTESIAVEYCKYLKEHYKEINGA